MSVPNPKDATTSEVTENTLLEGRVRLRQPRSGYRVAIDPVLLAAAVPAQAGERVLDVGTGTGAAALCLLARVEGCEVVGIEAQPEIARLAQENAALNHAADRFRVLEGDLRSPPADAAMGRFDHAMANPPYLEAAAATPARVAGKATANIEGEATLTDWVACCARMVRHRGSVTVVHRADRLDALLGAFRQHGLGAIVITPLWPKLPGRDAKRVIVSGRRGARSPLRLTPGLVLHRDGGRFTAEADAILRGGAALRP